MAVSDQAKGSFLDNLRRMVLHEAITAREQLTEQWSQPLDVRVRKGRAIEGLTVVKTYPDGKIELICERNTSRFREGDILCLNQGSPYFAPNFQVTLQEDDDTRLIVKPSRLSFDWGEISDSKDNWVLDEDNLDLSQYAIDALKHAGDSLVGRERILPLLMCQIKPRIEMARYHRALDFAAQHGLDASQSEALALAFATDLTYLIQGPPGTGKTRLLGYLVQLLVENGERVLISAFTHRAINNALNKVYEVGPEVQAIKIGDHSRADGLQVENYESFAASPFADSKSGYAIGATPFATRSQNLGGVEFDTIVFDEASQITLPLAIMGMLSGKRYIFIGDQCQLPPVLMTRHGDEALQASVFSVLTERGFDIMLEETYRLNDSLAAWPSKQFYKGKLKPANNKVAKWRLEYATSPERLAEILAPNEPKVFFDLMHRNTTTRSHTEASAVVDLIMQLIKSGIAAEKIGVVTPYRAQAREIRSTLTPLLSDPVIRRQIVVDTVERMQGQERDVIIFSLATSSAAFAADLAEFFFQPERLNVAITRASKKLIIVGSSNVLNAMPIDPDAQAGIDLLRDLLASCTTCSPDYLG